MINILMENIIQDQIWTKMLKSKNLPSQISEPDSRSTVTDAVELSVTAGPTRPKIRKGMNMEFKDNHDR